MFIANAYAEEDTIKVQGTTELPSAPDQIQSGWTSMIPMILIFVVFYFLLIRPQEKRRRAQQELVGGVKKGEKVVTAAGIFGTVTNINDSDKTVDLEIAKDISIKILKSSISEITSRTTDEKVKKENKNK